MWDCPICGSKDLVKKYCPKCGSLNPAAQPRVTAKQEFKDEKNYRVCPKCKSFWGKKKKYFDPNEKFCPDCGNALIDVNRMVQRWTCPECGKESLTGYYCSRCGAANPKEKSLTSIKREKGTKRVPKEKNTSFDSCPACRSKNLEYSANFCPDCGKMLMKQRKKGKEKIIQFGRYGTDRKKTPMEWIILEEKKGEVLLLSLNPIDSRAYDSLESMKQFQNEEKKANNINYLASTWSKCEMRKWLNKEFLENAFSKRERSKIVQTSVPSDSNPEYGTSSGNSTTDKIFLLSLSELKAYHKKRTEMFRFLRVEETLLKKELVEANDSYWLRTPGNYANSAAYVEADGKIVVYGDSVDRRKGVRPAMWISLDGIAIQ